MRATPAMLALVTLASGCWKLEYSPFDTSLIELTPDVGAPDGWVVEGYDMELTCPDGAPARFYLVYPIEAAADPARIKLPLAIVFHSGSFDYMLSPTPDDPTVGTSYQQTLGEQKRLTAGWSYERVFTTLGLYPNYDGVEAHAGTLVAALAEKGIATMLPGNCWGDWWHNRQSLEQNNFAADYFFRDGRTVAEFAWLHATTEFPPGHPVILPIGIDTTRVFLVGLGEGSRAVSELLNLRQTTDGAPGPFLYRPAAAILDSPTDDLRPFYDNDSAAFEEVQTGLFRVFPAGRDSVVRGSFAAVPGVNIPSRTGFLYSAVDGKIPAGANDLAIQHLIDRGSADTWWYRDPATGHVLSNANVGLSKAVADFLVGGVAAVDPAWRSTL